MKFRNVATAVAAMTLAASPAIAQAERASAPVSDSSEMRGRNGSSVILLILALAAIIAGIIIAVDGGDDPVSA